MPRLYLHIYDRGDRIEDDEGFEFETVEAARGAAVRSAREMIIEHVSHGELNLAAWIDIADETGKALDRVRFRDVVNVTRT